MGRGNGPLGQVAFQQRRLPSQCRYRNYPLRRDLAVQAGWEQGRPITQICGDRAQWPILAAVRQEIP